jgi:L-ribulose-5-phosphate 3-epimerase
MTLIDRRTFLESAAMLSAAGAIATSPGQAATGTIKKSLYMEMLPKNMSTLDKFKLAVDVGFEGIEVPTADSQKQAEEFREASGKSGLKIHSVMNQAHWEYPLSSADPEVVKKSIAGMETSIHNAKLFGATTVLLVPAVVDAKTMYRDAYNRSHKLIRERLLPLAQEQKIIIGIEEVWNKFLLSPLEFVTYVDSFQSPWVRAYFDVGNILLYGYPQDWIRTLQKRIVKLHVKDFHMDQAEGRFYWRNLGEGDVDWLEVRKALSEVGYDSYMTAEIEGGDATYLKDVVGRMSRIIAGQTPVAKA